MSKEGGSVMEGERDDVPARGSRANVLDPCSSDKGPAP